MVDEMVEKYAIRCARANNGGEWATHYGDRQKEFWRHFAKDLIRDITTDVIEIRRAAE